ncbi:hypothetical protein DFQ26_005386 [Actinomortierella ambigua]|nr:hypothetical protein DFQ26_005386 [Actinomortierella ambigua]
MSPSTKYQLHYFGHHGVAMTIRALLCLGGADWAPKIEIFEGWAAVKHSSSPFGTLPILNVFKESGEVLEIPESLAIERYLAKTFGMVGSTEAEQIQVDVALSLHTSLSVFWIHRVLRAAAEVTPKGHVELKASKLPTWIANCEKVLMKNGSNGHFVGDKFTYADVYASTLMDTILAAEGVEDVLNEKTAPNLFAVKRKVDSHPTYLAFRKSDEFSEMSRLLEAYASRKHFPFDMKKSHVVG